MVLKREELELRIFAGCKNVPKRSLHANAGHSGSQCDSFIPVSYPHTMLVGITVGGVSRNDVANPSESTACPDPETGSNNQPEKPGQYTAVVELANSWNQKAEKSCQNRVAHLFTLPPWLLYEGADANVREVL